MSYPNSDELEIIYNYIFYEIIKQILERDHDQFQQLPIKMNKPYLLFIESRQAIIQTRIKELKKFMHQNGLRIYKKGPLNYEYHWKNKYSNTINFDKHALKLQVENTMIKLFCEQKKVTHPAPDEW